MRSPVKTDPSAENGTHQQLTFGANIPKPGPKCQGQPASDQYQGNALGHRFLKAVNAAEGTDEYLRECKQWIDPENKKHQADRQKTGGQGQKKSP